MQRPLYSRLRRVLCLSEFAELRTFIGSREGLISRAGLFPQNRPRPEPLSIGPRARLQLLVPVRLTVSLLLVSAIHSASIFSCSGITLGLVLLAKRTGPIPW